MFDLSGGKLIIKHQDLMLPDFRILYKKDKSRTKEDVLNLFLYMHITSQIDSKAPYANSDPAKIKMLAKKLIYKDVDYKFTGNKLLKDEALVDEIINLYTETCITPARALVNSYNKKIYEFQKVIDETKPKIAEDKVYSKTNPDELIKTTFTTNAEIITKIMEKQEVIMVARDKIAAIADNESAKNGRVRASQKKSFLEITHVK
jgi:hypothetical protein